MKGLMELFWFFSRIRTKYDNIVADPDKREKSVSFGIQSIVTSLIGAVIVILCAFGVSALMGEDSVVKVVFLALLIILAIVSLFEFTLRGLVTMIYQLRVNKNPIGWVALAIWIVSLIAMIALGAWMIARVM